MQENFVVGPGLYLRLAFSVHRAEWTGEGCRNSVGKGEIHNVSSILHHCLQRQQSLHTRHGFATRVAQLRVLHSGMCCVEPSFYPWDKLVSFAPFSIHVLLTRLVKTFCCHWNRWFFFFCAKPDFLHSARGRASSSCSASRCPCMHGCGGRRVFPRKTDFQHAELHVIPDGNCSYGFIFYSSYLGFWCKV